MLTATWPGWCMRPGPGRGGSPRADPGTRLSTVETEGSPLEGEGLACFASAAPSVG